MALRGPAVALLFATAALPALQAAFPWGINGKLAWHSLRITSAADSERRAFAKKISELPRPIFSDDDIFALPWHSTGGLYPAFPIDHVFYDEAQRQGKLAEGGIVSLVRRGYFGSLVIDANDPLLPDALAAGYVRVGTDWSVPQAFQSVEKTDFVILERPSFGK